MKATHVNHINLKYNGNGKFTAAWRGWPSEDFKTVRRTFHTDYASASEVAADVAQSFAAWLESGPMGDNSKAVIDLVTCGEIKPDHHAVGVSISWQNASEIRNA